MAHFILFTGLIGAGKSCPFPCNRRTPLFERAEGLAAESETAD